MILTGDVSMKTLNKEEIQQLIHDCHINGDHRLANTLEELIRFREMTENVFVYYAGGNCYHTKKAALKDGNEHIVPLFQLIND